MYTQIWKKYLPVIRVLVKRAAKEDQVFKLNLSDFEKAGHGKKKSPKFNLEFRNEGKSTMSNMPEMAKELAAVLLEDKVINDLFTMNEYHVSLSTNFVMGIKMIGNKEPQEAVAEEAAENK